MARYHAQGNRNRTLQKIDAAAREATREDPTGDHLTVEQRAAIRDTAYNVMYEDCHQNWDYLKGIVRSYLGTMSVQEQAESISSDENTVREILGFDPGTGKAVEENDDGV
jgi:hypothetical protein